MNLKTLFTVLLAMLFTIGMGDEVSAQYGHRPRRGYCAPPPPRRAPVQVYCAPPPPPRPIYYGRRYYRPQYYASWGRPHYRPHGYRRCR